MVQYAQPELLSDLCASSDNLGTLLVEVIASVLDNEVSLFSILFVFFLGFCLNF